MEKKCNKFEELFINNDEKVLLEHIKTCEECRIEYKKMEDVSSLIKEVKPLYINTKKKRPSVHIKENIFTLAASFLIIFLAFFAIQVSTPESFVNETIASISDSDYTYEQMGLPVDEFGFIMVDYD